MKALFNDGWQFAELGITNESMYKDGKPVLFNPEQFYEQAQSLLYRPVTVPHDWMIWHVKDLYKNSVGCYKKSFVLSKEQVENRRNVLRFEGVYMNCGIWVNGKKAGEWKYGYATFEIDISSFVQEGENLIEVLVVYQNCNTRWYSGAGIFRDVTFINSDLTYLPTDGLYISNKITDDANIWKTKISVEVEGPVDGHKVVTTIADKTGALLITSSSNVEGNKVISEHSVNSPHLWDIDDPFFYIVSTQLLGNQGEVIDYISQPCGYKPAGFF